MGLGRDCVILLTEGVAWALITDEYGEEGVNKCQKMITLYVYDPLVRAHFHTVRGFSCIQDSFARARTRPKGYAAARPSARATIGYLVYKGFSQDLKNIGERLSGMMINHSYSIIT